MADQPAGEYYLYTMTGIDECVKTFCVSLPSNTALRPRRPCEAMKITSQPRVFAVSIMASNGEYDLAVTVSTGTETPRGRIGDAAETLRCDLHHALLVVVERLGAVFGKIRV